LKNSKAAAVTDNGLSIDQTRSHRQRRNGGRYTWKAIGKVVTVTADQPHPGAVAACHDAEAVVFDLVYPTGTRRRLFG